MAISDVQYSDWLRREQAREVLVEAEAYSAGVVVTRYLSSRGFVSTPSDSPANTPYEELLIGVPSINSRMAEQLLGRSQVSWGDVDIDNSNGERDSWLLDAWDGRPLRIYLGDPSWPKSDFRLVFAGVTADIVARDQRTLTLKARDKQHLLEVPALTTLVGGTGPAKDQRRPICYGEVKQIEPVLIDAAARTYAWHDGAVQSVDAVYVDGVATGGYTANLAAGTITLSSALTGRITLDGKGSKTGGIYVNTTGDIIQRLLTERTALTLSDINTASITALNAAVPGAVGLYVGRDGSQVIDALDALVRGVGGYYAIGRDGRLALGQLNAPGGTPVMTLDDDDLEHGQLQLQRRMLPKASVRLGYERYWSPSSNVAAAVTESVRQRMSDGYLVVRVANSISGHLLAVEGDLEPTLFVASADATAEATRRAALYGQIRRVLRLACFTAPQQLVLGDVVRLQLSRYGLADALAVVVGINESVTGGRMELEVFL